MVERKNEFLDCLGNGQSIYEIEADNDSIDDELKQRINNNERHIT